MFITDTISSISVGACDSGAGDGTSIGGPGVGRAVSCWCTLVGGPIVGRLLELAEQSL